MPNLKLDEEEQEILRDLGFTIADDKKSAEISDYVKIIVTHPISTKKKKMKEYYWFTTTLPDGVELETAGPID